MRTVQELTEELECANVEERRLLDDNLRLRGELDTIRAGFGASMEAFRNHVRNVERERDEARAEARRYRGALTFERFSEANRRRCESWRGFNESLQPESPYTLAHWALSIASEAGEVCDAILGYEGLKARRAGKTKEDIADELADVIAYCDLAMQKLGFETGTVLTSKFNRVCDRLEYGSRFKLPSAPGQGQEGKVPKSEPLPLQTPTASPLTCGTCGGTGKRPWSPFGVRTRETVWPTCTACEGRGTSQTRERQP